MTKKKIPAITYTRIVGYFAPYNLTANKGKVEEIEERRPMSVNKLSKYILADTGVE